MQTPPDLNEREQQILHCVVHTYITTAEPVGSRAVVKRFSLGLSPATVRNVMADLEDKGYLEQRHTSSGRVPTDRGYRYYVDYLMGVQELTKSERDQIEAELNHRLHDADEVLRHTSQLLALLSHQAGIAETPANARALVQRIELLSLGAARLAVLIVDSFGRVRTLPVQWECEIRSDDLNRLGRFLNEHLLGVPVDELAGEIEKRLKGFLDEQRQLAEQALRVLNLIPIQRPAQLYLEGATFLFEQPEFKDITQAKEVFGLFDHRERVVSLLRTELSGSQWDRTAVIIGGEGGQTGLEEISIIASPYSVHGQQVGMIGVLGPRRMPYSRLTAVVDYTAQMVSRILTRLGA
jgi:heat-inducible transcriptional repressor